jgi:hypothetical protein
MDHELQSLLRSIDQGDFEAIPKLAEWLEAQGDSRAELARQATSLDPQEIAEELIKIRSLRPSNEGLLSLLAEMAFIGVTGGLGMPTPINFGTSHVENAPTAPRWFPPSNKNCLNDVEKALQTKVLPADIARAIRNARRIKVDRLLAAFEMGETPTLPSPPAPG